MQVFFANKDLFIDRPAVQQAILRANQDPGRLKHAGSLIRSEVRRSMRFTKKKPAPPGDAPRWRHPEPNLRSIIFFWSPLLRMMAVGAPPFPGTSSRIQNVPEVHEFGGQISQPTRLKVFRPARQKSGRPATRKQLAALKRKANSPEARLLRSAALLKQPLVRVIKRYPARPYMWPALLRVMRKLPRIWAGSITRFEIRQSMAASGGTTVAHGGATFARAG